MNQDTMIYPFTKEALCNLITLMWRGHIDKIAIANPTNSAPYLIVDHTIYIQVAGGDDYPIISEEKKRTVINFNDTVAENEHACNYMFNKWRGQKK